MNRIDYLVEKFATGFKHRGHSWEVFENPDRKELDEVAVGGDFRFILDAKYNKVYVFHQDIYHSVTWNEHIKPETNDHRWMYKDPTLFAGSMESGDVMNWGYNDGYYDKSIISAWKTDYRYGKHLFSFAKKYKIDVYTWMAREFENE